VDQDAIVEDGYSGVLHFFGSSDFLVGPLQKTGQSG
jgi:hypothetical protein